MGFQNNASTYARRIGTRRDGVWKNFWFSPPRCTRMLWHGQCWSPTLAMASPFLLSAGPFGVFVARGWIRLLVGVTGLIASIAWHREMAQASFSGVSGPTKMVSLSMAEG